MSHGAMNYSRMIRIIAILLILGGIFMTCYALDLIGSALVKKEWPVAKGFIVKSEVVGEKRAFQPQITYHFFLDSIEYENTTDLHISGFGNKRSRRDNSKRIAGEYPVNKQVAIYYNPDNPAESFLRTGPYWSDYMKLMVGCIMIVCGLIIFIRRIVTNLDNI